MRLRISNLRFQNGFTLLEVVVAMAIVGLGVVTLLEVFSLGLRLGAKGSERTETAIFAQQVMDEVLVRREVREGGGEGLLGARQRWTLEMVPFQEESELPVSTGWVLNEITLQVGSQSKRGRQFRMKTLRLVREESR